MIEWRETCRSCRGSAHWNGAAGGICGVCDGVGHTPIPGAPSFSLETTLADREPGDVVVIGTGDRVRVLWHQPRKTKKIRPITTFVGTFSSDFGGEELEISNPIPLPSSFGVREVVQSRVAGDDNEGRGGDAYDPIARGARANRGGLI